MVGMNRDSNTIRMAPRKGAPAEIGTMTMTTMMRCGEAIAYIGSGIIIHGRMYVDGVITVGKGGNFL